MKSLPQKLHKTATEMAIKRNFWQTGCTSNGSFVLFLPQYIFFVIDLVRRYVLGCYRSEQCGLLNSDLGMRCTQAFVETLEKVFKLRVLCPSLFK